MRIGQAVQQARELQGRTQEAIGDKTYFSKKTISAIETGRRNNPQTVCQVAQELDDPQVWMAIAAEYTSGAFVPVWLDGQRVDLHRSSVREKTIEELREAIEMLQRYDMTAKPDPDKETTEERELRHATIMQVLDAFQAASMMVAVICREYRESAEEMYRAHRQKLLQQGHIQPRK